MDLNETMAWLESYGSEQTKKVLKNHGAREPFFGVKVGDMKKILKRTKKDHNLAIQLFETGNSDAMYLACLMADAKKITADELDIWAETAPWYLISEYGVAGLAADSAFGYDLGMKWIDSEKEAVAAAGWATLSGVISMMDEANMPYDDIKNLLHRIENEIDQSSNRVRYTMNAFIISVGGYCKSLSEFAIETSIRIGKVDVDMGGTSCKVPYAPAYINKMLERGALKKRKTARC